MLLFNISLIYIIRIIYLFVLTIRFSSSLININKIIFLISTSNIIFNTYFLSFNVVKYLILA